MIEFLIGLLLGGNIGFTVACLVSAGKGKDEAEERTDQIRLD